QGDPLTAAATPLPPRTYSAFRLFKLTCIYSTSPNPVGPPGIFPDGQSAPVHTQTHTHTHTHTHEYGHTQTHTQTHTHTHTHTHIDTHTYRRKHTQTHNKDGKYGY